MNLSIYKSQSILIWILILIGFSSAWKEEEDDEKNEWSEEDHILKNQSKSFKPVRVQLNYGSFLGARLDGYDRFTGIPFAEPPVGDLRLRNPILPSRYYHDLNVQTPAAACAQQAPTAGSGFWLTLFTSAMSSVRSVPFFAPLVEGQEDCLTLDIYRPTGVPENVKLPVMFFVYGGAFVFGATNTYPGKSLVLHSQEIQKPIIYVTSNYRLNAFGFLAGKEIAEAGVANLGLKDQIFALQWVQRHIRHFGGDSEKVTLFGQSAGSMSISFHLLIHHHSRIRLFRAAILESGTALPIKDAREGGGQSTYDTIVRELECHTSNDTLSCLRQSDFKALVDAQNKISGFLSVSFYPPNFTPSIDGTLIKDTPRNAFNQGKFYKVPMIVGGQDDEGTALGFGQISLINNREFEKYLTHLMNNATQAQIKTILRLYPEDITQGSPFNTSVRNAITPVFKRYSALLGDFVFHCLRRRFSQLAQSQTPLWGYLDTGYKNTPILGSFHLSELLSVFGFVKSQRSFDYQSRWISFAHDLDPNVPGLPHWSKYGEGDGQLLHMGTRGSQGMIPDNFRKEAINFLADHEGYLVV